MPCRFRAHKARSRLVRGLVRAIRQQIDLPGRLILAVEEVRQRAGFGATHHRCHRVIVGLFDHGLHFLCVRSGVFEKGDEVCVLGVDAAFECRLARRLCDDREPVAEP